MARPAPRKPGKPARSPLESKAQADPNPDSEPTPSSGPNPTSPPGDLLAQRYRLVSSLGEGGMGTVWLAEDLVSGQRVALKRLAPGNTERADLLRQEFARLAGLLHPNIVQVHDYGFLDDGSPYFTMEWLRGTPLTEALSAGDADGVMAVFEGACAGLGAIHAAGLVHGDVKPANILVVGGRPRAPSDVRLVDFGLAARSDDMAAPRGTPGFMAPEILDGSPPTPRSDLYGLGASLYTALAGRAPFAGRTIGEVLRSQARHAASPLPLRAAGVPEGIERTVLRLLERDPAQRPASAAEVWESVASSRHAGAAASRPRGGAVLVRGPLVGRDKDLERIDAQWGASAPPVLLTGPAGVGRTRFLREVALRAELGGARAVVVSCAGLADASSEWLRRASLVLGLGDRSASWAEIHQVAGRDTRVLLALEDLHAASTADLEVARQVLASQIPPGALVVLSWRDTELPDRRELADFLLLCQGPWLEHPPLSLSLGPLAAADSGRLVRSLLGGAELPEIEQAVHRHSGGVPAWIEAALLTLVERGALVPDGGRWRLRPEADLSLALPDLREMLAARVAALSAPAVRWLAGLAELGGEAAPARVSGISDAAAAETEVLASGLALAEGTAEQPLVRAQPLLAGELARERLEPGERRELTRRAAVCFSDRPERAAALWLGAGDHERALEALAHASDTGLSPAQRWTRARLRLSALEGLGEVEPLELERAADAAENAQRYEEAASLWDRFAKASFDRRSDPLGGARGKVKAAEARRWLADYAGAGALLDQAERWLGSVSDSAGGAAARVRASILNERSWLAMMAGESVTSEGCARAALEAAPPDALAERFTAWNRLAALYFRLGRHDEADAAVSEAFRLADAMNDDVARSRAHGNATLVARARGNATAEREHLESMVRMTERIGSPQTAARNASGLAVLLFRIGRIEEIREANARADALARSLGDLAVVLSVAQNAGRLELRIGNVEKGWQLTRATMRLAKQINYPETVAWCWNRLGTLHSLRGNDRKAVQSLWQAVRWAERCGLLEAQVFPLVQLAELALQRRDTQRADELLTRARERATELPLSLSWVIRVQCQLAAKLGDVALARSAIAQAADESKLGESAEAIGALLEARANLVLLEGDVSGAVDLWGRASALYQERSFPLHRARALVAAAQALSGLPSRPEWTKTAIAWLQEARSTYERIGAKGPLSILLPDLVRLQDETNLREDTASALQTRDALFEVSQLLNSILDFPDLLHKALRLVADRLRAERGLIVLVDRDTGELTPVARYGSLDDDLQADALQISTSIVRRVAATGLTFRSDDAAADPRLTSTKSVFELSLRSILCAALRLRDQVIGTIYLQNRSATAAFTDSDILLLESFANLISVAIENSRFHEHLRQTNEVLVDENLNLRREVTSQYRFANLIGESREMGQVRALIDRFAQADADVLIQGETGTGKELIAKTIHYNSQRKGRPFLSISCVALPESLIEAELFGIDDHVATGVRARQGIFERAQGGSVLLDEIGDMPLGMQARLLRVLQEREFIRVGGKKAIRMDVRIMAATNADLRERVKENRFRADLYFRVNRLVIDLPPLRERKSDIPHLARFFVERFCGQQKRPAPRISPELFDVLGRSDWPGNVRELEHYIERLLVICEGSSLAPRVLPGDLEDVAAKAPRPGLASLHGIGSASLSQALLEVEKSLIQEALRRSGGNRSKAARYLGLAEPTIRYRMKRLGILPLAVLAESDS